MRTVSATDVPKESALQSMLAEAHFYDAYAAPLNDTALTPVEIYLRAAVATPPWVNRLMSIRNGIVRQLGLKDVGAMANATGKPAEAYQIGDRIGIFSIFAKTGDEVVLGIDDRHLDVRVSILKPQTDGLRSYVVSTAVKVHNGLGRLYMAPVGRIHPLVVKALMRRAAV
jgi:Protein of unknown function (DUF2867)